MLLLASFETFSFFFLFFFVMCINRHLLQVNRRLARQSSSRLTMSRYVVYMCICARVWVVGLASASDVCIHIYPYIV
jgi:hypothetical protein